MNKAFNTREPGSPFYELRKPCELIGLSTVTLEARMKAICLLSFIIEDSMKQYGVAELVEIAGYPSRAMSPLEYGCCVRWPPPGPPRAPGST